ncbi:uncharacterized protein PRCAT00002330001 [Priceomyces carsonii]|uniref:uncharacterized protein n=1 Tax=Priceomyces carsonii TaxID=28549 RepID=UPI002ED7B57E|nr:unnamed protein product [Priceomyces carsonii]
MSGRGAAQPQESSAFEKFRASPAFTVGLNVVLFAAGVALIQSPVMDMLVPQL